MGVAEQLSATSVFLIIIKVCYVTKSAGVWSRLVKCSCSGEEVEECMQNCFFF